MGSFLAARKKAIIALVGAVATWAPLALADSHITLMEWQALLIALLSVCGVHEVANVHPLPPPEPAAAITPPDIVSVDEVSETPPIPVVIS